MVEWYSTIKDRMIRDARSKGLEIFWEFTITEHANELEIHEKSSTYIENT